MRTDLRPPIDEAAPDEVEVVLFERPPVLIDRRKWPVIASARWHDGEVPSQANRRAVLMVRQHDDGRRLVYGTFSTAWRGERDRAGGFLLRPDDDVVAAIREVVQRLDLPGHLADEAIADLPPEPLR
ncbi:MAG TPA: hypothetical protein VNO86_05080 [Candidatus Binatia bacterium]|nr:hypothetical protein [Candidatus Binatia bacterium]